ncbi:unnamed protein product [Porites lobata]|uniref:Uncharacterized protein n=1 Tax=Porites lobata TaxID=104759 RepID=A0ABN8MXY9_9CNID|nr:unnamed protein product [Porites lobata]
MPTPGSGVLDEILDVTKESLTESNSPNLTSKGTTLTGSSRSPKQQSTSAANTSQAADSAEGEGEARLLHKLDLLTSLVQDMVPVVKTLQESHDAWLLQDVDDVDAPSGLNDQATKRRKENIHRPTNSTLLAQTRVNSEIWDIAKKPTRSMDARLQALQDTLIKGLIPLADMTGKVGESLDSGAAMPTKETLWEALSNSLLLVAAANHSLNICRRDLFKTDLDDSYKALCNNKHPIGSELFGDDLAERLKTVTESNKAAKQLTRSNKPSSQKYKGPSRSFFWAKGGATSAPSTSTATMAEAIRGAITPHTGRNLAKPRRKQ